MSSDVKRQRVCVFCVCCMLASAAVLRLSEWECEIHLSVVLPTFWLCHHHHSH